MVKTSKSSVNYTNDATHSNERCSKCKHFERPNECKLVFGYIVPNGWCEEFKRARPDS